MEFAKTLTIRGNQSVVTLVDKIYQTGVKLQTPKLTMKKVEEQIERLPDLKKWFVSIPASLDESGGSIFSLTALKPKKKKKGFGNWVK